MHTKIFRLASIPLIFLVACANIAINDKSDMIRVFDPKPNDTIGGEFLHVRGEARGTWFFEATFPLVLQHSDGTVLAQHYATAVGDWMTNDFVPFESEINLSYERDGPTFLILKKSNPSGMPENEDELRIPVVLTDLRSHGRPYDWNGIDLQDALQ